MPPRKKHHFSHWSATLQSTWSGKPFSIETEANTVYAYCTACKVLVKQGRVGGVKFLVNNQWVSKRPACDPSQSQRQLKVVLGPPVSV